MTAAAINQVFSSSQDSRICFEKERGEMFFFGMCFVSINEMIPLLTDYPRQLLQ